MLSNKHRMAAYGCLSTVVAWNGAGQAFVKKFPPVFQYDWKGLFHQIGSFFRLQFETAAELAPGQGGKKIGHISH